MKRTIEIELELQPTIAKSPPRYGNIYQQACSGDEITVRSWRDTWIKNYGLSKERFGEFGSRSYGQLHPINRHKPAIVCGSGPSLKGSIDALRENKLQKNPVLSISCLHNFGYFEDEGCHSDYYLTLDSGPITLTDVTEGRKKKPDHYWDASKDHTLIANVASDPTLFDKWKGKILLFNTLIPDQAIRDEFNRIEPFHCWISTGGNAAGACLYTAKAVMGSGEIMLVGTDFCFGWGHQFHSYGTQYDNFQGGGLGAVVRWPDIYGIPRVTWPSYQNFKFWMDWVSQNVPGRWVSCSEGIMGSYPEGNLATFSYMPLANALETYRIADTVQVSESKVENGKMVPVIGPDGQILKRPVDLAGLFGDPNQPMDITLF